LKRLVFLSLSLAKILFLIPGCFTFQTTPPAQPTTTTIDPDVPIYSVPVQQGKVTQPGDYPVINFTGQYLGGTSFQLNWNVINATQIVIDPDIGQVQPTGSRVITVPSGHSKVYRLTANNGGGSNYWQVIVASP